MIHSAKCALCIVQRAPSVEKKLESRHIVMQYKKLNAHISHFYIRILFLVLMLFPFSQRIIIFCGRALKAAEEIERDCRFEDKNNP